MKPSADLTFARVFSLTQKEEAKASSSVVAVSQR